MRNIEKLSEKRRNKRITNKMGQKQIKYKIPLKAQIVLYGTVAFIMCLSPLAYVALVVWTALRGLWDAFIELPLDSYRMILQTFVDSGVAKPISNEPEPNTDS